MLVHWFGIGMQISAIEITRINGDIPAVLMPLSSSMRLHGNRYWLYAKRRLVSIATSIERENRNNSPSYQRRHSEVY
jgi:hypothetical protein